MNLINKIKFVALLLVLSLTLTSFLPKDSVSAKFVIENMFSSIDKINSLKFTMKKMERVEGKILTGEQDVKFNRAPKKIYTKLLSPNKGTEVLYIEGKNKNNAYVNPNSFPYVTLSLDPYGSLMRNNNHHTVHEVGFDYINSIIRYIAGKSANDFNNIFYYQGDTLYNNRQCFKILIDYKPYSYVNYTVREGETLTDIAYRLFVSDYVIKDINKDIDDYDDIHAGQVIKVPNAYARKTYLYIDKKTFLPLIQVMYDDRGFLSKYEFENLILNPSIPDEEFSKDYTGYGF